MGLLNFNLKLIQEFFNRLLTLVPWLNVSLYIDFNISWSSFTGLLLEFNTLNLLGGSVVKFKLVY